MTLDDQVMYQVVYDADGSVHHAIRYTDPDLVARHRELITGPHDQRAEPIAGCYSREIAPLLPPHGRQAD